MRKGSCFVVNAQGLKTYSPKERNMYMIGMAGQNIIYNIIGAGLAYYLQFTILIPAMAVSSIMALARVWDAFNDPMMGSIVDRTRTKWGKCRPYLLFIPVPILIITVACFLNGFYDPSMGVFSGKNAAVVLWAAFTYILWGMSYTIGDIPLWGVTPLMTEVEKDRTNLLSITRIVATLGASITLLGMQPISLALGGIFAEKMNLTPEKGEQMGFIVAALGFGILGTLMFQMTGIFVKERIKPSVKKNSMKQNFKLMWTNKPFRQILLSGVLGSPKQLLSLCAMPLVTYYYASKDPKMAFVYMVLLGGGMFIGMFVGQACVPLLTKKLSKKTIYNGSNLICILPFAGIFLMYLIGGSHLVDPVYLVIGFFLFLINGAGTGIGLVLQSLMIADAVDYEDYHNHIRPDGVFFSGQSFITKLSMGIATMFSGVAYSIAGFSDARVAEVNQFITAGGIPRDNPEFAPYLTVLFFLVSIPPAIGCILAVLPTWNYCLSDKEHNKILEELNQRRHEEAKQKQGDGAALVNATDTMAQEVKEIGPRG